jgi:glutathione S-transferase
MALQLYFGPGACSFVPHAMLQLSGVAFEPIMVKLHKGEQKSEPFLSINPRGQVPVIVHDGQVLDQLVAIVLYLDDLLPDAHILPPAGFERAHALQTLAWMNNTVHATFAHIFMPQRFSDDAAAQQAMRSYNLSQYAQRLAELEHIVATQAKPWLTGDKPGALDAYALTLVRWAGMVKIDPTQFSALWALANQLVDLPALSPVIERERLQLNLFSA